MVADVIYGSLMKYVSDTPFTAELILLYMIYTENFTWSSKGDISLFMKKRYVSMEICDSEAQSLCTAVFIFRFCFENHAFIWRKNQNKNQNLEM